MNRQSTGLNALLQARRRDLDERRCELTELDRLAKRLRLELARIDSQGDDEAERRAKLQASLAAVEARAERAGEAVNAAIPEIERVEQRVAESQARDILDRARFDMYRRRTG